MPVSILVRAVRNATLALVVFPFAAGCSPPSDTALTASLSAAPSPGQSFTIVLSNGRVIDSSITTIPPITPNVTLATYTKDIPQFAPPLPSKIEPELAQKISTAERAGKSNDRVSVVVTFVEDTPIPRFSSVLDTEARDSPTNQKRLTSNRQLVDNITSSRSVGYGAKSADLLNKFGASTVETFWLINAMTISIPFGHLTSLSARSDVQYVELDQKATPPPSNQMADVRALLVTDPYFSISSGTYIGLLDTGVRITHTLLQNKIGIYVDCVNGNGYGCAGPVTDPSDSHWNHGTSSASEIVGTANLGDANRGVTQMVVDSYKVYNNDGLVTTAAVRGYQTAVSFADRVIVAEIQYQANSSSAISAAANSAFDALAATIAAAGNYGPNPSTLSSPGNAADLPGVFRTS